MAFWDEDKFGHENFYVFFGHKNILMITCTAEIMTKMIMRESLNDKNLTKILE